MWFIKERCARHEFASNKKWRCPSPSISTLNSPCLSNFPNSPTTKKPATLVGVSPARAPFLCQEIDFIKDGGSNGVPGFWIVRGKNLVRAAQKIKKWIMSESKLHYLCSDSTKGKFLPCCRTVVVLFPPAVNIPWLLTRNMELLKGLSWLLGDFVGVILLETLALIPRDGLVRADQKIESVWMVFA